MVDNSQSTTHDEASNEWGPCPAGTIGQLVGKLKRHRRLRRARQVTVVAGCLLLLVVVGRSLLTTQATPGTMSHAEVAQVAEQFVRGELDDEQTRMVEAHIKICPQCEHLLQDREEYRKEHGAQLPVPAAERSKLVAHSH